jgi:hypothetical protein
MRVRASFLLALWGLMACRPPATEVVVRVDSDYAVPEDLDELVVEVVEPDGNVAEAFADLRAGAGWPRSVGIVHRGGPLGPVRVTARGLLGGTERIAQRASFTFVREESRLLALSLLLQCEGVMCGEDQTCDRLGCVGIVREALPPFEAVDGGGVGPDVDGGVDGGVDAGTDAAVDAGRDAGETGPSDGGPEDAGVDPDAAPGDTLFAATEPFDAGEFSVPADSGWVFGSTLEAAACGPVEPLLVDGGLGWSDVRASVRFRLFDGCSSNEAVQLFVRVDSTSPLCGDVNGYYCEIEPRRLAAGEAVSGCLSGQSREERVSTPTLSYDVWYELEATALAGEVT